MEEIVDRLKENRQIELAKSILESNGYVVSKKLRETKDLQDEYRELKQSMYSIQNMLDSYGGIDTFSEEREGTEEIDIPCKMLGGDYKSILMISDEDEGGEEVIEFFRYLDKKELREEGIDYVGYMILYDSEVGQYVYQNLTGLITIYVKK